MQYDGANTMKEQEQAYIRSRSTLAMYSALDTCGSSIKIPSNIANVAKSVKLCDLMGGVRGVAGRLCSLGGQVVL